MQEVGLLKNAVLQLKQVSNVARLVMALQTSRSCRALCSQRMSTGEEAMEAMKKATAEANARAAAGVE